MSRRIYAIQTIGFVLLLLAGITTGCGTAPDVVQNSTPTDLISTLQKTSGSAPTSTPTLRLSTASPSLPTTFAETPTTAAAVASPETILDSIVPQGALTRLGRGVINQVVAAPDDKTFAVAGGAGIFLFQKDGFQQVWSKPTANEATEVVFSADGSTLAAAITCRFPRLYPIMGGGGPVCVDQPEILILNPKDGGVLQVFHPDPEYSMGIAGIQLSPDGGILYLGLNNGRFSAWNVQTGQRIRAYSFPGNETWFFPNAAFSGDGSRLATWLDDGTISLFDLFSGSPMQTITKESGTGGVLAFSPDGARLAAGAGGRIDLLNLSTGKPDFTWNDPYGKVTRLAFSPDGRQLISGDDAGKVIQWDAQDGHCLRVYSIDGQAISGISPLPGTSNILAASAGSLFLWDALTGNPRPVPADLFSDWQQTAFSEDGKHLMLQQTGSLQSWSPDGQSLLARTDVPKDAVFSPQLDTFAQLSQGNLIRIYSTATRALLSTLKAPDYLGWDGHPPAISNNNFVFSPDGKTAATLDLNWRSETYFSADIWDLSTGASRFRLSLSPYTVDESSKLIFSPDGGVIAYANFDTSGEFGEGVYFFDAENGAALAQAWNYLPLVFDLAADNHIVATGCDLHDHMGTACLYDTHSGDFISGFAADNFGRDDISSIKLSPDGRLLTAGTIGGNILVWRTADGTLWKTWSGQSVEITRLAFSPDSRTLASVSKDGTVVLWDLK